MILFVVCFIIIFASSNGHTARKFGLCPPDFIGIGSSCYFISKEKFNWLDAHFECKDKNGKLTEPTQIADRQLRKYLKTTETEDDDMWIGGSYEWNNHKWVWGYSGNEMKYNSFSKMNLRWSARQCVEMNRFICEHKMYKTTTLGKQKIYHRWNATYPHKFANEVLLSVNKMENLLRNPRRKRPSYILSERQLSHDTAPQAKCSPNKVTTREQAINCNKINESLKTSGADHLHDNIGKQIVNNRYSSKNIDFDQKAEWKRQKERKRKRVQLLRKQVDGDILSRTKQQSADTAMPKQTYKLSPPLAETLPLPEYTLLPTNANNSSQVYQQTSDCERMDGHTISNKLKCEGLSNYINVHTKNLPNQEQGFPRQEKSHNVSTASFENDVKNWKEIVERLGLKEKRTLDHMKLKKSKESIPVKTTNGHKSIKGEIDYDKSAEKQLARMEVLRQFKEKLQKEKRKPDAGVSAKNNTYRLHNDTTTPANLTNDVENFTRSEEERKSRMQRLRERIKNLTHEQRKRFHELRMQRRNQKKDQT